MESVQTLLNNVLFLLLPILVYRMFWLDRDNLLFKQKRLITFVVIPITILLCMSFPLNFNSEFIFDLRYVPFILGGLYIGFPAAIAAVVTIIPYRMFIGGEGAYWTTLGTSLFLLTIPFFKVYFLSMNRKGKNLLAMGIALIISLLTIFVLIINGVTFPSILFPAIAIAFSQVLATWLILFLIEDMFHYKALRERVYLQTDKLSTISELSASVSHEVRNPLTVTKGFLQLLYSNDLPDGKRRSYIDLALSELYRGEAIISDFLSLTKSNQETIPLDVVKELNYVHNIISPYALMYKVNVETSFEHDNVVVDGVASHFRQCLINIAKNGIEAMPDGGTLELNITSSNTHVFIEIKDTGIGMSPKEVAKLGTQYYTTKEKGTGLGTPLIFRIVESMNGCINIQSQKGKGTKFIVKLPTAPQVHYETA
ncbi:two-component system sporulation sensor kinase B [Evansella vedderi]|uniref:histidine kinase n=1 Tax=Evansella vedderi TaxID=38282 RepID=A0ABT9ZN64_9BACI|nr:sensor histidine kinase [Evansella vedderi]MDQ0252634.1 two-component system sporulation sensor kinase B [Evansella vedderi]